MPEERCAVVIEDDSDIRLLLREVLRLSGFAVHEAPSGRLGIEAVERARPDLVTLDLGLPDLDGIEVCRRIRELTDAYIIMITARAEEIDRLIGLEIGADDFVSKPFSPREVKARIAAMFRRPRTGAPADLDDDAPRLLRHGPLEVDLEGRTARMGDGEVLLTRIEFDLLATMLSGPRRVWSRESLLHSVWGPEWTSDPHLVEVHIGNLRRKLAEGAPAELIRTVRGVGYRLAPAD